MKFTSIKGLNVSKLSLGTAQLGFDYGIVNVGGKPNLDKSFEILKTAINAGINCFDTAPSYGDSEEIIGSFVADMFDVESPIIFINRLLSPVNSRTSFERTNRGLTLISIECPEISLHSSTTSFKECVLPVQMFKVSPVGHSFTSLR